MSNKLDTLYQISKNSYSYNIENKKPSIPQSIGDIWPNSPFINLGNQPTPFNVYSEATTGVDYERFVGSVEALDCFWSGGEGRESLSNFLDEADKIKKVNELMQKILLYKYRDRFSIVGEQFPEFMPVTNVASFNTKYTPQYKKGKNWVGAFTSNTSVNTSTLSQPSNQLWQPGLTFKYSRVTSLPPTSLTAAMQLDVELAYNKILSIDFQNSLSGVDTSIGYLSLMSPAVIGMVFTGESDSGEDVFLGSFILKRLLFAPGMGHIEDRPETGTPILYDPSIDYMPNYDQTGKLGTKNFNLDVTNMYIDSIKYLSRTYGKNGLATAPHYGFAFEPPYTAGRKIQTFYPYKNIHVLGGNENNTLNLYVKSHLKPLIPVSKINAVDCKFYMLFAYCAG